MTARRGWSLALVGSALLAVVALAAVVVSRRYCLGQCRGDTIDCAGVERWMDDVRLGDIRDDLAPRRRVRRARFPFVHGVPCGSGRWGLFSHDTRIQSALTAAAGRDGTVIVTLRYLNPATGDDEVAFEALGLETRGYDYLPAAWFGRPIGQ